MDENKNITAAAAEETIESIKKLMEAIGNDSELKAKLEETLAALTGKSEVPQPESTAEAEAVDNTDPAESKDNDSDENIELKESMEDDSDDDDEEDDEEDNEDDDVTSSKTELSYVFNDDAIAGLIVGFAAGAAIVGGGVLLHKLLK